MNEFSEESVVAALL